MNKRFIMKYFSTVVRVVDEIRVAMTDWSHYEPIFVHSFGKVGSMSVYHSLKKSNIRNAVYHTHLLTQKRGEDSMKWHAESGDPVVPHQVMFSLLLARQLKKNPDLKFKVVTLLRDPIDRAISSVFENIHRFAPSSVDGESVDLEELNKNLMKHLSSSTGPIEYLEDWLESEIKGVTGIDLLSAPFSIEKGWSINSNERVSVLTIKMDRLTEVFPVAISEFLNIPSGSIQLKNSNVGHEKWYASDYKRFKNEFILTSEVSEKVRASSYVKKFYPDGVRYVQ